ncbi:unnamed protein product [Polarella glacialis]|uniref:Uncharacterized protein n=1 Tax=Polarella glacialis TaxID=89957 RepID=A0A813EKP4_POLGL|nr:unnamed protein product [Polarella glacialis]CAE8688316.1 unnamed protein product [Polarella glacialis]
MVEEGDARKFEPNICTCENGMTPTGPECQAHGNTLCSCCSSGFRMISQNKCGKNTCTCAAGSPATGIAFYQDGVENCAFCNEGYRISLEHPGHCDLSCVCLQGQSAVNSACTLPGSSLCNGCDFGWHLSEDKQCAANGCTRANGNSVDNTLCAATGSDDCASCGAGSHLNGTNCEPNVFTCEHGVAASGANCTDVYGEKCAEFCDVGYSSIGTECLRDITVKLCSCENGDASTGTFCPLEGLLYCSSCHQHFHLESNFTCSADSCSCDNGVAADCATGQECTSCESGYYLSQKDKLCHQTLICSCQNGYAATNDDCTMVGAEVCRSCQAGCTISGKLCAQTS